MAKVRPSAVAGHFYPDNGDALKAMVAGFLGEADAGAGDSAPKAIIAPHAGLIYSGAPAGAIYRRVKPRAATVSRVVLVGPAHRVALRGVAASSADAFATPLGRVPVDREGVAQALSVPGVAINDLAHRDEHCLEVQLPFLATVLDRFALVPLLVGDDPDNACAAVLDRLWGGPETLIVISSDLSHYHDYDTARAIDRRTCQAIVAMKGADIGREQACGRAAIRAALSVAGRRGLAVETVALCNSGDTAGPRDRVVGYGAWALA